MGIELFARGLVIGFAIAAPVGPIGMLVIRRTLAEGRLLGLLTGLGAAVADALYGCVGAFGLTFISSFLMGYAFWTKLIGGAFLVYLGISTFRSKAREESTGASNVRYATAFLSTMVLTLANPATILSFMAVFAGLGLGAKAGDYGAAGIVVKHAGSEYREWGGRELVDGVSDWCERSASAGSEVIGMLRRRGDFTSDPADNRE